MRSKEQLLQSERALATAEATLLLLREQLSAQDSQRRSDREWFEAQMGHIRDWVAICTNNQGASLANQLRDVALTQETLRSEMAQMAEVLDIPVRDIPTIDELLEQAKSNPAQRKLLENTLAELEFSDPQIEFN